MGYIMGLRKVVGSRLLVIVGASVIVMDQDELILLQLRSDNNCWALPGGSLEPGEALEEVTVRELQEETGLITNNLIYFKTFSGEDFYYQYPHGDKVYNVILAYLCFNYTGKLEGDKTEVKDLQYFSLNKLPTNLSPPDQKVVNDFRSFWNSA